MSHHLTPKSTSFGKRHPIHVFISSPSDCSAERGLAVEVIHRVADSPLAKAQRIELKPLLWESLPPGPGKAGDAQSRIDEVLTKYGLRRYQVYLGFMKGRAGTPTPRAASGTIDEFESALRERRATGAPTEILFYFLPHDAPDQHVRNFRGELDQQGFLYATTSSLDDLEQRVEEHLLRIVAEWHQLQNRLRRQLLYLKPFAKWVAAAMILVAGFLYIRFDLYGSRQIAHAAQSASPLSALDRWDEHAPYLVFHRSGTRDDLQQRIAAYLCDSGHRAGLVGLDRWRHHATYHEKRAREVAESIAAAIEAEVNETLLERDDVAALTLWREAESAGIWALASQRSQPLLTRIAGQRLFFALIDDSTWLLDWDRVRLRDFEANAVRSFAQERLDGEGFAGWASRRHRLAAALLVADWERLEELATDALGLEQEHEHPEIQEFVGRAPAEQVCAWLRRSVKPSLPGPILGAAVDGAKARCDAQIALALLDLTFEGQTHHNPFDLESEDLLGAPVEDETTAAAVRQRLLNWITQIATPDASLFEACLPYVNTKQLTILERESLADYFVSKLSQGSELVDAETAIERFLARINTTAAAAFLKKKREAYLGGTISDGIGEREALIRGLVHLDIERPDAAALALAQATREQAKVLDYDDSLVQAEYLRTVQEHVVTFFSDHAAYLRQLIQERAQNRSWWSTMGISGHTLETGVWLPQFDQAMSLLLASLSGAQIIDLFQFPDERDPGTEFDGSWDRWLYLLERLANSSICWPADFVGVLLNHVPSEPKLSERVLTAIALHGGETGKRYFAQTLTVRPLSWLQYVALAGDDVTLNWAAETAGSTLAGAEAVLDAAEMATPSLYQTIVRKLVLRWKDERTLVPVLLYHASAVALADGDLLREAQESLSAPPAFNMLAVATRYCSMAGPDLLLQFLKNGDTTALRSILLRCSLFELASWSADVKTPSDAELPEFLAKLASERPWIATWSAEELGDRPVASVNGKLIMESEVRGTDLSKEKCAPHYFPARDRFSHNALLSQLSRLAPIPAARFLVEHGLGPHRAVEVLGGDVIDPESYLASYCWWLAAGLLHQHRSEKWERLPWPGILASLASDDSKRTRAAAALVLALPVRE